MKGDIRDGVILISQNHSRALNVNVIGTLNVPSMATCPFFLPLKFENWRNRIVAREKLCVREIAKTDVVAIFGQQQDILKLHQFILSWISSCLKGFSHMTSILMMHVILD